MDNASDTRRPPRAGHQGWARPLAHQRTPPAQPSPTIADAFRRAGWRCACGARAWRSGCRAGGSSLPAGRRGVTHVVRRARDVRQGGPGSNGRRSGSRCGTTVGQTDRTRGFGIARCVNAQSPSAATSPTALPAPGTTGRSGVAGGGHVEDAVTSPVDRAPRSVDGPVQAPSRPSSAPSEAEFRPVEAGVSQPRGATMPPPVQRQFAIAAGRVLSAVAGRVIGNPAGRARPSTPPRRQSRPATPLPRRTLLTPGTPLDAQTLDVSMTSASSQRAFERRRGILGGAGMWFLAKVVR